MADEVTHQHFITCKKFWVDAAERAVKTAAQTVVVVIGPIAASSANTWLTALETAASAALLSVFSSIASTRVGDPLSAAAVRKLPRPVVED